MNYPPSNSELPVGDTSTAESIVSSARSVRDDFHFGDDLAITNPPNWDAQESRQLYDGAMNNNDPGTADSMGQAWHNQGKDLVEASNALYEAITELSGAWIGQAAGAAQGALIGVANASSTAGDAALAMGKRMSEQAAAAAEIKKMPPPKEYSTEQAVLTGLTGGPAAMVADIKAQRDAAEAVKAEQKRYMDAYTKAMSDVDRTTPDFGPESIGMKPVSGGRYGSTGVGGVQTLGVSDGGPGLSGVNSNAGAAANGVGVGSGQGGGAGGIGGGHASDAGAHPGTTPLGHTTATGPLSTSATGQVSTASTGPGLGATLGAAALGAGVGVAGMKAYGKSGKAGGKKHQPTEEELAAAAQAEAAQDAPADAQQPEPQANAGAPASPQVPHVGEAGGGRHAAPAAGAPSAPHIPQVGEAVSGTLPGQYGSVPAASQAPYVGEPSAVPPAAESAPLEQGKVFAAGDAAPGDVSASNSQAGPAAAQQQSAQPPAQQQAWANQAAASGMAPPVAPMGGGGAGMGGAGAGMGGAMGGAEADHTPASYLIQPDPDEMFGVGEAVTSGVIGAEDEDD